MIEKDHEIPTQIYHKQYTILLQVTYTSGKTFSGTIELRRKAMSKSFGCLPYNIMTSFYIDGKLTVWMCYFDFLF